MSPFVTKLAYFVDHLAAPVFSLWVTWFSENNSKSQVHVLVKFCFSEWEDYPFSLKLYIYNEKN